MLLIPERTVDSMFAIEVAQLVPHALVWSPTNTRGAFDHEIPWPGVRAMLFECKGTKTEPAGDPEKPWKSPINRAQLQEYLHQKLPVLYILPVKPIDPDRPWIRRAGPGRSSSNWCEACHSPSSRRWAGMSQTVQHAPFHLRFQPWFAHWCWVVPAANLNSYLLEQHIRGDVPAISTANRIPGAVRLCRFLADVRYGQLDLIDISLNPALLAGSLRQVRWPAAGSAASDEVSDVDEEATIFQVVFVPEPPATAGTR